MGMGVDDAGRVGVPPGWVGGFAAVVLEPELLWALSLVQAVLRRGLGMGSLDRGMDRG